MNTFRPGFRGGDFRRRPHQQPEEAHRINDRITAREVRVVLENGDQLGVITVREALTRAEEMGLDLVEVAPQAKPPVCKIMDYGKFKYREQKKEAEARKKRADNTTKEIRIRYRTDVGDFETKLKHAKEFLDEGDKVKFSMRFKGREVMYIDLGVKKFDEIIERLSDCAVLDERSPPYGKQLYIVLAPSKGASKPKEKEKEVPKEKKPAAAKPAKATP